MLAWQEVAEELVRLMAAMPFAQLSHIPFEAKQAELLSARK